MTPEQEEKLYRIDRTLRASGMQPLNIQELRGLSESMQTLPPEVAEGGLINDETGLRTQAIREALRRRGP